MAYGLDNEEGFYCGLGEVLARKRQLLERQLADIGFKPLPAQVGGCMYKHEQPERLHAWYGCGMVATSHAHAL